VQRQEGFIASHDVGGLRAWSRGNHHVIVRITDHDGHLQQIGYEGRQGTEALHTMEGLCLGIVVALAVPSLPIKKRTLGFVQHLLERYRSIAPSRAARRR
jgi:hypothetical protein